MDESPKVDSLAKAVRTLAIAVGCLAVGVLALFALYAFSLFKSRAFFRGATTSVSSSRTTHPARSPGGQIDEKPFHTLPPEEKIKRSTAILLTKHQKDGGGLKAVVSEILKRPDAGLNYSVGDEFVDLSRYEGGEADYGDGDVVFFGDATGDARESMPYRNGRITALGDMPLDVLKAMIRGEKGAVSPPAVPSARRDAPVVPPFSSRQQGPLIDLERTTNGEGVTRSFSIPKSAALGIPEWFPEKGEPPLKMSKAIQLATDAAGAQSPEHAAFVARSIRLQLVSCDEPVGNRWYYVLDCVPRQNGGFGMSQSVPVVVLMDGTVVTGTIKR
jgi:hypothetical protein